MALKIQSNLIKEDIVDENGNKLGELKFNPNDSRIMKNLSTVTNEFNNAIKELNKLGNIDKLSLEKLNTIEDFEKASDTFEKIDKSYDIEVKAVDELINRLSEIFGKETIELFTNGTKDAECLLPIIEFIEPYVKKAREGKVNKYLNISNNQSNLDVME